MKIFFTNKLKRFDEITRDALQFGCSVAEHEATLRYGKDWRIKSKNMRHQQRKTKFLFCHWLNQSEEL